MPTYVIFALVAALAFAATSLITKLTSRHAITDPWVLLVYYYLTLLPPVLTLPLLFPVVYPDPTTWPALLLYGFIFFIANVCSILAIYRFDVSSFAALVQTRPAVLAVLAFFFLGERLSLTEYGLLGVVIVGAMLVTAEANWSGRRLISLAGLIVILQQVCHALANLFAAFALRDLTPVSLLFWGTLISAACTLPFLPILGRRLRLTRRQMSPMIVCGWITIGGMLSLFTAFQSNLTISFALAMASSPLVLTVAMMLSRTRPTLLEHHPPRIYVLRAVGVALILLGAATLARG